MSGGSWGYFYSQLEQVSDRLIADKSPLRRALGHHLAKCAKALHDIEWVDSCDYGDGDERDAIKAVLEDVVPEREFDEVYADMLRLRDGLADLIDDINQRKATK